MRGLAPPFGRNPGGIAALWPTASKRRNPTSGISRSVDPWFDPPRVQDGETVLADLESAETPADAARVLVRYLAVRLLRSAVAPTPGFMPEVERAEARSLLRSLPLDDPDRLALAPFVDCPVRELGDRLAGRLDSVGSADTSHRLGRSTFALLHAGYDLAFAGRRYADAALIARQLAAFVAARGENQAARRWKLRACGNERRSAAGRSAAGRNRA